MIPGEAESAKVLELPAALSDPSQTGHAAFPVDLSAVPSTSISTSTADRTPQDRAKHFLMYGVMHFCASA